MELLVAFLWFLFYIFGAMVAVAIIGALALVVDIEAKIQEMREDKK
jgi:hypothetical protein